MAQYETGKKNPKSATLEKYAAVLNVRTSAFLPESPVDSAIQEVFWLSIASSLTRISLGFFLGFVLGLWAGVMSFRYLWVKHLLHPVILICKSVPVASFIILILIWFSSSRLSVIISFIMVFPIVYTNLFTALENLDPKLNEMGKVFDFSLYASFRYLILPQVMPFLRSATVVGVGMALKAGIAAELIGLPQNSIGEQLYLAKIYLDTPNLFAWTFAIVILSYSCEKIFALLMNYCSKKVGEVKYEKERKVL